MAEADGQERGSQDRGDVASLPRGRAGASSFAASFGLAALALVAALSLGRGITNAVSAEWGSTDLHAYWLAGHVLREGRDPYAAFVFARRPAVPVRYLDGAVAPRSVIQPGLGNLPANTAPMTLLLAPLAWWSWPVARGLWAASNLALLLAIPWLALGLASPRPPRWARWATASAFWSLVATRVAIGTGQTTLLALASMLGALLLAGGDAAHGDQKSRGSEGAASRTWSRTVAAGLLLGLAVSKYSLAPPAVLWLAWRRRWGVLAIAAAVQALAFAVMAALPGGGWKETLNAYLILLQMHLPQDGIHLAAAFGGSGWTALLVGLLITGATVVGLRRWPAKRREGRQEGNREGPKEGHVDGTDRPALDDDEAWNRRDATMLAVLATWTLLVAYHRVYDVTLLILLLAPALAAIAAPFAWGLTRAERNAVAAALSLGVALLAVGGEGLLGAALPDRLAARADAIAQFATTGTVLAAWLLALWLHAKAAVRDGSATATDRDSTLRTPSSNPPRIDEPPEPPRAP